MGKFVDYSVSPETTEIMEKILETFPDVFPGFDVGQVGCVHAHDKISKKPIALTSVSFPHNVWNNKTYICTVADASWKKMSTKQKNLSVFHTMCAIPEGGFDTESKKYGRIRRPDIQMYTEEFAVSNGVPNWMENDAARDPMDAPPEEITKAQEKSPVTIEAVTEVE